VTTYIIKGTEFSNIFCHIWHPQVINTVNNANLRGWVGITSYAVTLMKQWTKQM